MERIKVDIPGFSSLVGGGIEKGSIILVTGGCGSGKSIFGLQFLYDGVLKGEKCVYVTFEENPEKLKEQCKLFGWDIDKLKKGEIEIMAMDPLKLESEMSGKEKFEKEWGRKLEKPWPFPFYPDRIVIDSLSALSASFKQEEYRERLSWIVETTRRLGATSLFLSECDQSLDSYKYSRTGIEEYIADGVIVLYYLAKEGEKVRAIEIRKLRRIKHSQKVVPFKITDKGIVIYPEQIIL